MVLRVPTPPKEAKPVTPRGKTHTTGPKTPASTKPKSKLLIHSSINSKFFRKCSKIIHKPYLTVCKLNNGIIA